MASEIVDAQIHIGPGGIAEVLSAMDALGIKAALLDEYWLRSFANEPHHLLEDGTQRPVAPTAELACQLHPDRFAYLLRVDLRDPDYAAVIRQVRDAPGGRALRVDPGMTAERRKAFAGGGYDHIFAAAAEAGLPLFAFAPDDPAAFARAAQAFPSLRLIVDHCGLFNNAMRSSFRAGSVGNRESASKATSSAAPRGRPWPPISTERKLRAAPFSGALTPGFWPASVKPRFPCRRRPR